MVSSRFPYLLIRLFAAAGSLIIRIKTTRAGVDQSVSVLLLTLTTNNYYCNSKEKMIWYHMMIVFLEHLQISNF